MPPKAGGIHFRQPHFKLLGSPHDGYHRVGRGAIWTGAILSIPRPSPLPHNPSAPNYDTATTEQVPPTPPHQRRIPQAESIRGRRTGDGSTSGPGDGRGPLPAPEGPRARPGRAEHGWHHESWRFRPVTGDESAFLRAVSPEILCRYHDITNVYDTKEHHYGPDQTPYPLRFYGAAVPSGSVTRRGPLDLIQIGRSEFGLFQGFAAQNA